MRGRNGKTAEKVVEELEARGVEALESAQSAIKDADLAKKVDRLLNFSEDNATVIATVGKRLAGDAAKEASIAASTVGEAVGDAAEAVGEAAAEAIEAIGEEVIKPSVKYGRGLRHGLILGAAVAVLYTPWPGAVVRERLKGMFRDAMDIVDAMRTGAADAGPGSV